MDLGLGAASLAFQIFGGVIKGYDYFQSAVNAETEVKSLVLRLKIEQCRLLDWGTMTGLSDPSSHQSYEDKLNIHKTTVVAILTEMESLLLHLRQISVVLDQPETIGELRTAVDSAISIGRSRALDISEPLSLGSSQKSLMISSSDVPKGLFRKLSSAIDSEKPSSRSRKYRRGLNHLIKSFEGLLTVAKEPGRLMWAVKDKKAFQNGLQRVKELTDYLHEMVSEEQNQQLLRWSHETCLSILQLTTTIQDMEALSLATRHSMTMQDKQSAVPCGSDFQATRIQLQTSFEKVTAFGIRASKLKDESPQLLLSSSSTSALKLLTDTDNGARTLATYEGNAVWVEWRDYKWVPNLGEEGIFEPIPNPSTLSNIRRLTSLLHTPDKPDEFCVPQCLGFFDDPDHHRFGLVFEVCSRDSLSLLSRFGNGDVGISKRFAIARHIAECLLYLHAVNWLHKGLRSAAIVFDKGPQDCDDMKENIFVSGFGFSRPVSNSSTSTGPPSDTEWASYCHPDYLDETRKSGYRKSFDIHSLGIIMIELAHWKPINQILNHSEHRPVQHLACSDQIDDVSCHPIDIGSILPSVCRMMGQRYYTATKACIEGLPAFGLSADSDESNPFVAALLQQGFIETVVDPLRGIVV